MSTDPAHSLADSFDLPLTAHAQEIAPDLWAEQIDAQDRLEANWRDIQEFVISFLNWAGVDAIEAEELSVIPGLAEIFSLTDVKHHADSGRYDLLVVDCAPTAETLRLLSLPEAMNWYIERIFPVERRAVKTIRPILQRLTSMPIADDRIFAAVERLHRNLDGVRQLLTNERMSSVRLVMNLEKMKESFQPVPIITARLFDREMVGLELLGQMGDELYGGRDGLELLHRDEPIRVRKRGESYVLSMRLPFADRTDLDVFRKADELFVRVGAYKRNLMLPQTLQRLDVKEASFVEDRLEVRFAREPAAPVAAGQGKGRRG